MEQMDSMLLLVPAKSRVDSGSRQFTHFYIAYSHLFGCSNPPPYSGAYLNLAYVHKFMNLNFTDTAHLVSQLTKGRLGVLERWHCGALANYSLKGTVHYGWSEEEAQSLSNRMNALYNVRCAPLVTLDLA